MEPEHGLELLLEQVGPGRRSIEHRVVLELLDVQHQVVVASGERDHPRLDAERGVLGCAQVVDLGDEAAVDVAAGAAAAGIAERLQPGVRVRVRVRVRV